VCRIVIDYTQLPDNLKELDEPEDVKKMGDRLNRAISELQNTIQRIQAPNMRVSIFIFCLRHFTQIEYTVGRAMAQAVRRWPLTSEARIRAQVSPCRICGGHIGTGTEFSPEFFGSLLSVSFHRGPLYSPGR